MINAKNFFSNSNLFDTLALRQLSHINGNWELTWDKSKEEYIPEDDSFSEKVNELLDQFSQMNPPSKYHDNEDRLAEYVKAKLNWNVQKIGNRWVGSEYPSILEQGAFSDIIQDELCLAAAGRIQAAIKRGQFHFDEMERFHQKMLADVIAIILFHRADT